MSTPLNPLAVPPMPAEEERLIYALLTLLRASISETQSLVMKVLDSGDPFTSSKVAYIATPADMLRLHLATIDRINQMIECIRRRSVHPYGQGFKPDPQMAEVVDANINMRLYLMIGDISMGLVRAMAGKDGD